MIDPVRHNPSLTFPWTRENPRAAIWRPPLSIRQFTLTAHSYVTGYRALNPRNCLGMVLFAFLILANEP